MATWTVIADIDAHVEKVAGPDGNYGSSTELATNVTFSGGSKAFLFRSLMNFDLSGFPGDVADITSAKLTVDVLLVFEGGGDLVNVERCTRPADWVEAEVTWNDYNTGNAWTTGGGDVTGVDATSFNVPSSTGLFDITGLKPLTVDGIDNRSNILSIISSMDDEADAGANRGLKWRSSEATSGTKPTLEITYGAVVANPGDPQNFQRQVIL